MISLSGCKKRRIYKLLGINLRYGVFDGYRFIGIRKKFGFRMLDTEDHWDTGPPFGTARAEEDTGIDVPEEIVLRLCEGNIVDKITRKNVAFDRPIFEGGKGWYFIDTGESNADIAPIAFENKRLFDFLDKIETGQKTE